MVRNFFINGISFCVADYKPLRNDFEKGLKYQLLIEIKDGMCVVNGKVCYDNVYRSTGVFGSTIKELREYAKNNISMWL